MKLGLCTQYLIYTHYLGSYTEDFEEMSSSIDWPVLVITSTCRVIFLLVFSPLFSKPGRKIQNNGNSGHLAKKKWAQNGITWD